MRYLKTNSYKSKLNLRLSLYEHQMRKRAGVFSQSLSTNQTTLTERENGPRILNINCWGEWTEGHYLEPDAVHEYSYLEAIRDVFQKSY